MFIGLSYFSLNNQAHATKKCCISLNEAFAALSIKDERNVEANKIKIRNIRNLFRQLAKLESENPALLEALGFAKISLPYQYYLDYESNFEMIITKIEKKIGKSPYLINKIGYNMLKEINTLQNPEHKLKILQLLKKYKFNFSSCKSDILNHAIKMATSKTYYVNGEKYKLDYFFEPDKNNDYLFALAEELKELRFFNFSNRGQTPTHITIMSGNTKLLRFLLEKGNNSNITNLKKRNCAGMLLRLERTSKRYDNNAFRYHHDEHFLTTLRLLVQFDTVFDDVSTEGFTPLYWILHIAKNGNTRPLETLIQMSTSKNKLCEAFVAQSDDRDRYKQKKNQNSIKQALFNPEILYILCEIKNADGETLLQSCEKNTKLHAEISFMVEIAKQSLEQNDKITTNRRYVSF